MYDRRQSSSIGRQQRFALRVDLTPHKLFLGNGIVIAPVGLVGFAFEVVFVIHAVRVLANLGSETVRKQ